MFPASSTQIFGHGCTMPGPPGDPRGQDLDPFIPKWQGSSAVIPGLQMGNADMRKGTCTPTFQIYTVTGGTMDGTKGLAKPAFGPLGERVEGGTKHSDSLLRAVRSAWPSGGSQEGAPFPWIPQKMRSWEGFTTALHWR